MLILSVFYFVLSKKIKSVCVASGDTLVSKAYRDRPALGGGVAICLCLVGVK